METETTLSAEDLDLIQRKQIERGERRRRRMKQQLQRPSYTSFRRGNNHQPVLFFREMVAERVPQMVQRSKRRAAKLQRWFADFLALDEETGVRDVKYRYIGNVENRNNRSSSSSSKNSPSDRMSEKKRDNDVIDVSAQIVQEIKIKTSQPIRRSVSNSNENDIDNVVEGGVPLPKSTRKGPKSEADGENQQSSHETYRSDSTANTFKSQRSGYHENWVREVRQPPPLQPRNQRPRPTMLNNQSQPTPPSRKASKSNERSEVPNNLNTINIYRLPPPENWQPKVDNLESSGQDSYRRMSQRQQQQRRSVARQKPKKVYSPYKRSNTFYNTNGEKYDDRDVVDRMGDFLADTAEAVMYGKYDVVDADKSTISSSSLRNPKHWKDRLEESLDSMLGIHEDGGFYDNWAERFGQGQKDRGVDNEQYDAFDVAQGRRRPPSKKRRRQRQRDNKPFWEEDNNLVSILFGGRGQSFWDDIYERPHPSGSVLFVLRASLRSFALVFGRICRWAGTHGALPQPVVVLSVSAAGLCAPSGRRLWTLVGTILVLRTAGELLHGYLNDGEFSNYNNDDEQVDSERNNSKADADIPESGSNSATSIH